MDYRFQRPGFLNQRDTYEMYEKRVHSPVQVVQDGRSPYWQAQQQQQQPPTMYMGQGEMENDFVDAGFANISVKEKKKFPIGWIIGIAIAIPLFVILILFAAVQLQELGII